ncbi:MAG: hypothetical protein JO212_11215, partial [Acetobacteraceae bacterium]|nr:hypothetical protein [Acetobacteraceae bacterium]
PQEFEVCRVTCLFAGRACIADALISMGGGRYFVAFLDADAGLRFRPLPLPVLLNEATRTVIQRHLQQAVLRDLQDVFDRQNAVPLIPGYRGAAY